MEISKGTIVRTILLIIALINLGLKHFGFDIINVSESEVLNAVEYVIEIAIIVVGFWKNNSYTEKAIEADKFLQKLRESEDE